MRVYPRSHALRRERLSRHQRLPRQHDPRSRKVRMHTAVWGGQEVRIPRARDEQPDQRHIWRREHTPELWRWRVFVPHRGARVRAQRAQDQHAPYRGGHRRMLALFGCRYSGDLVLVPKAVQVQRSQYGRFGRRGDQAHDRSQTGIPLLPERVLQPQWQADPDRHPGHGSPWRAHCHHGSFWSRKDDLPGYSCSQEQTGPGLWRVLRQRRKG